MNATVKITDPVCCPVCGAELAPNAPQGLCPKCLIEGATAPTEPDPDSSLRHVPPALEAVRAAFPHLEILELMGVGGMGAVYKARQPKLDRLVALKLLSDPLGRQPAFAERFHREARVLAKLNHPNIVSVFDFGEAGGFFYLVMELVDGVNLRQAMRAGRCTPRQALEVVPRICEALQFAHEQGILHRDIKPENILLDSRGRVKIADFGIAKLVGTGSREVKLTASGAVLGTPAYMAPEQLEQPGNVDHRADIYSLGVVFYEMLTGELPLGRFAPPSQKTPVDERVDAIVLRALAKERELRQQSAGEVKTQVESVAAPPRPAEPSAESALSGVALTSPKTSWKAVVSAVLSVPLWLQSAVVTTLGLASLFRRDVALSFSLGGSGWVEMTALSLGGLLSLLGLILGVLALGDIRRARGRLRGTGLALMGVLGAPFGLALTLTPMVLLTLGLGGYVPAPVGRWLYSLSTLGPLGLLLVTVNGLKRWVEKPVGR